VAQEAPGTEDSLIDIVLAADTERADLMSRADTETDAMEIAEIHMRLSDIDAHSGEARAASILSGLGFDAAAQQRPASSFSGGWRMRVALAALLFSRPDILLLDEPTNYLDLEGTLWLENFVARYPGTVLIISHDRDLLNKAVDSILHLEARKLNFYRGTFDSFERQRAEQMMLVEKAKEKQDAKRKHLQSFVDRFKAKASKAKQAQSRVKMLEKMQPITSIAEERVEPIRFPEPDRLLSSPIIRLEHVQAGYSDGKPILRNLDLRIDQDDRIALLGANGNGKSTFAKLLAGKLAPLAGDVLGAGRVTVGYFAQHQLDELNPQATPFDYIVKLMPDATEAQRRTRLGTWGFGADKADTKCANLSGGEKARLLLALTAFHAPHLLILDEPTNHLDVDSREALIHAIAEYEGAVILISHDRHLVEATADRLWLVADGTVRPYDGDMESYRAELLQARAPRADRRAAGETPTEGRASRADQRRAAADRRAGLAPLKKAVQTAEKTVERLSGELAKLDALLASPDLYADAARASRISQERGQTAKRLAEAEEAWLAATSAYEDAEQQASSSA
jgi:ATP-binding cassette subfamily F protein 3